MTDPKAPKFLQSHIDKLNEMWKQANTEAENRLKQLKGTYARLDISLKLHLLTIIYKYYRNASSIYTIDLIIKEYGTEQEAIIWTKFSN